MRSLNLSAKPKGQEVGMRPVEKGASPVQAYAAYADAIKHLEDRLGSYCSYCERRLETHLAVEHVLPKSLVPSAALLWSNFLLACVNCNSCKGDQPVNLPDYLWPHLDNTLQAFRYGPGGVISVDTSIPLPLQTKAEALRRLVGLDRLPGAPNPPTDKDRRWLSRQEVWALAERSQRGLAQADSSPLRQQISETALASGMFSIWWEVFAGDGDMRLRLIRQFVGTCPKSFDANGNLQPRPGGQL